MREHKAKQLKDLDEDIISEAIFPYLERLTDFVNLSYTCKFFCSIIFSGRICSVWSSSPVDICTDSSICKFGCGRSPISQSLALSIMRYTSVTSVRLHMQFSGIALLLEAILGNPLQFLKRLHIRFRTDEETDNAESILSMQKKMLAIPIRPLNITHLAIYGFSSKFPASECLNIMLSMFGKNLETLRLMETSPTCAFKILQTNVCPALSNLCIQGEQYLEDLWGFKSDTLKSLSLHDTTIKLSGYNSTYSTLRFPFLVRLELIDRADVTSVSWRTEEEIRDAISTLPLSLKEIELRIDSILANQAIVELSKRLSQLETLSLQLPDRGDDGPTDISLTTILALRHGCPSLQSLEISDGLTGFEVDAFVALKDFKCLRKIKLLYDDNIVDALPRLLQVSSSDTIEDVQFYENAGEIFNELDGAAKWDAMEERLLRMSGMFSCVNIILCDCWWT